MSVTLTKKKKERTFTEMAEANQAPGFAVKLGEKYGFFWEYANKLKELQELETKSRKVRRELEAMGEKYPELLSMKGLADRMFNTEIFDTADKEGGRVWIHAKDSVEAEEEVVRRKEAKKKEKERIQESKKKKQKTETKE